MISSMLLPVASANTRALARTSPTPPSSSGPKARSIAEADPELHAKTGTVLPVKARTAGRAEEIKNCALKGGVKA